MEFFSVFENLYDPQILLLTLIGTCVGIVFGCIPGLNTPVAIALMLPFTYSLSRVPSIALILAVYMGGISGGLLSAILLRIPGTPAAIATTLDGHPMAKKGKAAEALAIGTFASFIGGILSAIALMTFAPFLSKFALSFGPWEFLSVTLFALSLVCTLMEGRMVKGFITVFLGLILASIGSSPIDGSARFTLGNIDMLSGFNLIVFIIGIYAFSEILGIPDKMRENQTVTGFEKKNFYMPSWKLIKGQIGNMLRSALIGIGTGILPGIGATAAGMFSYTQAKKFSKHPEEFGKGCPDGVFATETANNAVTGGALIPALVLSVPGDPSTAVIIGALMIQGIQCGPLLAVNEIDLFRTIILIVFLANVFMFLVQGSTIRWTSKLITAPKEVLIPVITVFCCIGAFTVNNRMFDLYSLLGFAILGYILQENDYPLMPIVLAYVLGPSIEAYYRRTLMYYDGIADAFFSPSFGFVFFLLAFILPIASAVKKSSFFKKNKKRPGK